MNETQYKITNEAQYKKIITFVLVVLLFVLAFIIIRSIAISIIFGLLLAHMFTPVYKKIDSRVKSPNLSTIIIFIIILFIILIPLFFLIPFVSRQILDMYLFLQRAELSPILQKLIPSIMDSPQLSAEILSYTNSFTSDLANFLFSNLQKLLLDLPSILMQLTIVLFTFYFALRDNQKMKNYLISVSPLTKESSEKFFMHFKKITNAIVYGQVLVGFIQGILSGIGFLIFGVPNSLFLTLLAIFTGVLPIIGPVIVWFPASIYLLAIGKTIQGIGLLIYGSFIVSSVDNVLRPIIISKNTKMHTAVAFAGMIGGLFVFGVVGLVVGPLILEYLIITIEFYRERNQVKT